MTTPVYFSTETDPASFPLQLDLDAPTKIGRWRPLYQWILAIPHFFVMYVISAVAGIMWIVSFFSILFTGEVSESVSNFIVMALRYQWRVQSYAMFLHEEYPPFEYEMVAADPGGSPATLSAQPQGTFPTRWLPLVKWALVIPQFFVLFFLAIGLWVMMIIAFFTVLFTGEWPESQRRYAIGFCRWSHRVSLYYYLQTDVYPPFSMEAGGPAAPGPAAASPPVGGPLS